MFDNIIHVLILLMDKLRVNFTRRSRVLRAEPYGNFSRVELVENVVVFFTLVYDFELVVQLISDGDYLVFEGVEEDLCFFLGCDRCGEDREDEEENCYGGITFHKILYVSHSYAVLLNSN